MAKDVKSEKIEELSAKDEVLKGKLETIKSSYKKDLEDLYSRLALTIGDKSKIEKAIKEVQKQERADVTQIKNIFSSMS